MMKQANRKKARRRGNTAQAEDSPELLLQHVLKGTGVALATGAALLFLLSLALYFSPDPTRLITPAGLLAATVTALTGGFTTTRLHKRGALLCGLLSGISLMLVMLLASLLFVRHASGYSTLISCALHTALVLLSVAGAYLALRAPQKKKKKRR